MRSALTLSLLTGQPFEMINIRANRRKPGLKRQHLTALHAAQRIGNAEVRGDELNATEISFAPQGLQGGDYVFAVGTAGSASRVLQTVLLALTKADKPSRVVVQGGTHNDFAPPYDFLAESWLPLLRKMGVEVESELIRPGFYPAGGGEMQVTIKPCAALQPIEINERIRIRGRRAVIKSAQLPERIAEQELAEVMRHLDWDAREGMIEEMTESRGPGNVVLLQLILGTHTEVFSGFGRMGVPAKKVAGEAIRQVQTYLKTPRGSVSRRLADQLLIPMAMAGGGSFRTGTVSKHTTTNAEVVQAFLDVAIEMTPYSSGWVEVQVSSRT